MVTQGSYTSMVCEKHAGLLLARWLNPAGTKYGKLAITVRPYGDWSER